MPWSLKNPFQARLTARRGLTAPESAKDTQHIEIALGTDGPRYLAGDSLAVIPRNDAGLITKICGCIGASGDETVTAPAGGDSTLREVLATREITRISKDLVQLLADTCGDPAICSLFDPDNRKALAEFRSGRDLLDALREYPNVGWTPQLVTNVTGRLMPRLYSIASGPDAHPGEVHLTVGVVNWEAGGRARKGVCSSYLGRDLEIGDELQCYTHHAKNFKLPADPSTDVVMVGPGTGIAPFRAFLEQRQTTKATGRNWLLFGDQHRATDFLYHDELEAMQASGHLTRLDLAFSRDQEHKIYVQHRMAEHAAELWAWLEGGAHLYVCGDALRMAKDVDATLHQIAEQHGTMTPDQAIDWVKALKKAKRYQRDVYAV
jgi:sulfite reductase (NADPH) flavoprotein alpha-component